MGLELFDYIIILIGGFVAGIINVLAGFGSIITLSLYIELIGLPGNIANATNRVNVLAMNLSSSYVFYRKKVLNINNSMLIFGALILGAMVGVGIALNISSEQFKGVFKYLLILCLAVVLIKPSRLIKSESALVSLPKWFVLFLFFLAGIYGGFIQMGIGVFILVLTVALTSFDLIKSNAFKTFSIGVYTMIVLGIFASQGLIDWKAGALMALGQASGGYFGATFASNSPNANKWAYRMLIFVIVLALIKAFFF